MSVLRKIPAEAVFLLVVFLFLLGAGRKQMFADPGALWHPVTGEKVLTEGFFRGDPYGFREYHDWFAKDWLAEVIFAYAHRWAGPDGMLLVPAGVLALFYTFVFHRLLRAGCHWTFATLLALAALAASAFHFFCRPLIFTLVCLGWMFARFIDVESGRKPLRSIWWCVPLIAVWANLHPGVLGGIGTIGLAAGGWSLWWLVGLPSPVKSWRDVGTLVLWTIACIAALAVHPFGFDFVRMSVSLASSPLLPKLIDEHRHLTLLDPDMTDITLALSGLAYLWYLWKLLPQRPPVTWMISLAWLLLAIDRVRNGELFLTTAILVTAEWLPRHPWLAKLAAKSDWYVPPSDPLPRRREAWGWTLAPFLLLLALAMGLQRAEVRAPLVGKGWANIATDVAPVEVLPALRAYERTLDKPTPIFNDMNFGGFVIYFTPKLKVFIDDRCELYGDTGLMQYWKLNRSPEFLDYYAEKFGLELALVQSDRPEKSSGFDQYLKKSPQWVEVQRGKIATVYRRRIKGAEPGASVRTEAPDQNVGPRAGAAMAESARP